MMLVKDWQTLVETVAHEMIHLHQARAGTETRAEHNREWHRLADTVCKRFGWQRDKF
jgi:predicted SprT family Zn-dependent metalloprotease